MEDIDLLAQAAREAGRIAMGYWRQDPESWLKNGSSPVSEADLAVDRFLREALGQARPRYGWVSEETETEGTAEGEDRFFVVDPIDGTRAFLRGEETWCVSVAVVEAGRPVAGVLEAPALAETFLATASGPATLNGAPITASGGGSGAMRLSMPDGMRRRLEGRLGGEVDFQRSIPSLAYRLALVAAGRLDGTIVGPHANDWDVAAADLILERAGGRLARLDGERHLYKLRPARHGVLVAGADAALERLFGYGRAAAAA
ncbi:3'(2'),5'-bisphosphate nucleotidase CysQ [Aureimonas jatrophae]|jgi:myo-inositol-1(or 4)-monophosphatase|uniref:Myo-inositol-1(Or 4)-monophosphatase n=1 Tax=Aureimonas jatrophae TaxID=1166073 RepID=A0A1H0DMZ2_9HYPH|nr:3'(2'),5'-bisphosphate nucleotidase CysQ [Aureimonas jatrophae]SDN71439.1 myo-inositol-1(or 4)-monophosphatase [Aureimonas jatrophae]